MAVNAIKVGQTVLNQFSKPVNGELETIDGVKFYKIKHFDQMPPFFMSIVSHSDQWLFVSSLGGLTAGRKNPDNALFPYYTDDKIHDSHDSTGSKTIILASKKNQTYLWEPFTDKYKGAYKIERNLLKNIYGNELIFEEFNHDLGLHFSYRWRFSQKYGLVKKTFLKNISGKPIDIKILDGIRNVLPYGISPMMQNVRSTLLDAYKKNELLADSGLGLFLLSSIPVDKAEPSEALKATTVWQTGLEVKNHLLSTKQLDNFRKGQALTNEVDIRAERGAYMIESHFQLAHNDFKMWYFTAELNQGPAEVVALNEFIQTHSNLFEALEKDIHDGTEELIKIVAQSDGLQKTSDDILTARHFANVMFNVMRGGIFDKHYQVPKQDFVKFFKQANPVVAKRHQAFLENLPNEFSYMDLNHRAKSENDTDLQRLCLEYLPLTFSRRHGDPSRPWNRFSIELTDEFGGKKFYYQGNWRDIFQNWEALALAYPRFLESMITKFVNASTVDGYNPYRITRDGIDWEVIEENDPWSYIGYWGDHQIIYLLKLMELLQAHQPDALQQMLSQKIYAYADVPYRIKGYEDLLKNPQDTVDFDHEAQERSEKLVATYGADGKLVRAENGVVYTNFTEKILVSLLAKLSNYIPEGGIWMNTQRPEWNDANNALVGYGVSMVTLGYIRRFIAFCQPLFADAQLEKYEISAEVGELFQSIANTFQRYSENLNQPRTNQLRREIMDELGKAGEAYRNKVYQGFSNETTSITSSDLDVFFTNVLACTDHTIAANQREDKLYHSYNLMRVEKDGGVSVRYLYEMLEGQVAMLSNDNLSVEETLEILKALKNSRLYREDQHSYILYPDRQLPRFEAKNNIPEAAIQTSELLQKMVASNDRRIIEQDIKGGFHFNGSFNNQNDVIDGLANIGANEYGDLPKSEQTLITDIFEQVFDHQSFTGRSGTFFGYEGLGCIYWHMVSKLILAVEEQYWNAVKRREDASILKQLMEHYYDVRAGLGFNKTPDVYGAFPTDPYSHTPGNAGAQQPGMTGQVKEDILSRFGELGVFVEAGKIKFEPRLLRKSEFLANASTFDYVDLNGEMATLDLPVNSLAFTYCQVPMVYHLSDENKIVVHFRNGETKAYSSLELNTETSNHLFDRTDKVARIEVYFNENDKFFV